MQEYTLPINVTATTSFVEAIQGAQYAIHAVPVQHSRTFLQSIAVSNQQSRAILMSCRDAPAQMVSQALTS